METEKHVYGLCTCKNKLVLNSGLFVVSNITPQSMKKKTLEPSVESKVDGL